MKIGQTPDLFHLAQKNSRATRSKSRINQWSSRSWLMTGSQCRCGLELQVMTMTITADPGPTTICSNADARYLTDAEVRAAWCGRTRGTCEFEENELGWTRYGEAPLPIAAPIVA